MQRFASRESLRLFVLLLSVVLVAGAAGAVAPGNGEQHDVRNFDARVKHNLGFTVEATPAQRQAEQGLGDDVPGLAVEYDQVSGAARTLSNHTGYLSGPQSGDPMAIALDFVADQIGVLGLTPADLGNFEVTDRVFSQATGSTHIYLRQLHQGLALYNGQLQINVNRDGRILSVNNAFLPHLAAAANAPEPSLNAAEAVAAALRHLGVSFFQLPKTLEVDRGVQQRTLIDHRGIAQEPIQAQLMWLPVRAGDARLVWNFQIYTLDSRHAFDFTVDAHSGAVWTQFDWANDAQYRVYEQPVESPNHTTPLPPADARTLAVDPADTTASPLGWHNNGTTNFTNLRGNNVWAYEDSDANNAPPASEPTCGASLNCDFPISLSGAPSTYRPAATANLFYWNNVIHDVQYLYGFDEVGGNFQVNNLGNGGLGNDDVRAEAQDGSGTCNANMLTPVDGTAPRMQMYICNNTSPAADGDLDNAVIVHEYGHGISIRQVGGPGNSSCLNNSQQGGEGWSDWHGLVYTAEVGDQGTDSRGIGTYLFGQPANGPGIRPQPYSTNPAINNYTYASINGLSIPHGVGSVWAQVLWEAYWALVAQHGFDPDLYNAGAGAGNHRALLYVNQGFKNTICSPTFVNARDGIIQAAVDNFGGEDVCLLWDVFANYGLGTNAVSGGPNSTSPTNGFQKPIECTCSPAPIANAGPDKTICAGDSTTIGTPAQPSNTYSWSPGGQTTAQITVSPAVTTTYTVTATTAACGSANDSVNVFVDDGSGGGIDDDFESGATGWSATGLWHLATNSTCASPSNGYSSPVRAFYYGQDTTCNYATAGANNGTLTSPIITGITPTSTLTFDYYRVVESFSGAFDATSVEIVSGATSTTVFALDSSDPSTAAWTSSGPISLSAFAGQPIQVRFRFDTGDGVANNFTGWFIDDVVVTGDSPCDGPANTAPVVDITAPANGASFPVGTSVTFTGTATDAQDGNLTAGLAWTSSINGAIGSGGSFSTSGLSVGSHTITAAVTDSGGLPGSDSISITINVAPPVTVTFTSIAAEDGWILESGENTNVGGTLNSNNSGTQSLRLGDNNQDRQYKTIVSFDTSSIPDGATVISATLRLRRGALSGTNPFTILGSCFADIQTGAFGGNNALAVGDFQAAATATQVATMSNATTNGSLSEGTLNAAGRAAVNRTGRTQLRVYFQTDDNNDNGNDFMGLYSANNGTAANRPVLEVTYQP